MLKQRISANNNYENETEEIGEMYADEELHTAPPKHGYFEFNIRSGSYDWVEYDCPEDDVSEEEEYEGRMSFIMEFDPDDEESTLDDMNYYDECRAWCAAYKKRNSPRRFFPAPHKIEPSITIGIEHDVDELTASVSELKAELAALAPIDLVAKGIATANHSDAIVRVSNARREVHEAENEEANPPRLTRMQAAVDALSDEEEHLDHAVRNVPRFDGASLKGAAYHAAKNRRTTTMADLNSQLTTCRANLAAARERLTRAREIRLIEANAELEQAIAANDACKLALFPFKQREDTEEALLFQIDESEKRIVILKEKLFEGYTIIPIPGKAAQVEVRAAQVEVRAVGGAGGATVKSWSKVVKR